MSNKDVNVAANKLDNDPFAVYNDVDVTALQDEAIKQSQTGEAASRKETQMQLANILARYTQGKLIADAMPTKLYTVLPSGEHVFCVGCAKIIARIIYDCPEKDEDGNKQPLPQHLLARVRRIAPLVFYSISNRIPLVWSDKRKALAVPRWMTVSDEALSPGFWNEPEKRTGFQDDVYLDGKQGRTLDSIIKRVEKTQKPVSRGTNSNSASSPAEEQERKLRSSMSNHGLEKTLELVADMFTKAPSDKPLSDVIIELLAVCCEHVNVRNGSKALGKAVAELSSDKGPARKQSAA